jgi:hypothetical protein
VSVPPSEYRRQALQRIAERRAGHPLDEPVPAVDLDLGPMPPAKAALGVSPALRHVRRVSGSY